MKSAMAARSNLLLLHSLVVSTIPGQTAHTRLAFFWHGVGRTKRSGVNGASTNGHWQILNTLPLRIIASAPRVSSWWWRWWIEWKWDDKKWLRQT